MICQRKGESLLEQLYFFQPSFYFSAFSKPFVLDFFKLAADNYYRVDRYIASERAKAQSSNYKSADPPLFYIVIVIAKFFHLGNFPSSYFLHLD